MLNEFKSFLTKGNAIDMAVGFIFGAAFAGVVKSFLANVLMPPIGLLMGDVDFSEMSYALKEASGEAEAVVISYGLFIMELISFVILGFIVFLLVRTINNLQKEEEEAAPAGPSELDVLQDILKAMKK